MKLAWDSQICVVGVLSDRPLHRQETIRRTQRWAEEHGVARLGDLVGALEVPRR